MSRQRVDSLVIGAGAAGLSAARDLSQAGKRVVVVEARQRIGGRIFTLHDRDWPLPVELGAEFVHGEAAATFAIIRAAGLLVDELPDHHYWSSGGKLETISDFWQKVDKIRRDMSRRLRRSRGADFSFARFVGQSRMPAELRQLMLNFVEGYHAAYPDAISARSLAASDEEPSGNVQFRILSGGNALVHWLRGGLDPERTELHLNTMATRMRWKRGEVVLECRSGAGGRLENFRARTAVIALPLGVLKAQDLRFKPALDPKTRAIEKLEAGQVFKIVLRFRRSFWEEDHFIERRLAEKRAQTAPLNFVHAREAEVPTWWSPLPAHAPLLTGWAGGPRAESLLAESESTRTERSLAALAGILDVPRKLLDELLEGRAMHDWRSDPFSRGAYSYVGVGGVPAQRALARPVEQTLFFAGEATDPDQTATVAGAIASGRRAAREVLRVLH